MTRTVFGPEGLPGEVLEQGGIAPPYSTGPVGAADTGFETGTNGPTGRRQRLPASKPDKEVTRWRVW
jgi:hypothetical protein